MSDIIDNNVTVKNGNLLRVENKKVSTFTNAKNWYYALWIEDHTGLNERCILLTQLEYEVVSKRAKRNPEDCICLCGNDNALRLEKVLWDRPGRTVRVYNKDKKHWNANKEYIAVIVKYLGEDVCLLFTDKELAKAENRANNNPEDIPKKSFLNNLLD